MGMWRTANKREFSRIIFQSPYLFFSFLCVAVLLRETLFSKIILFFLFFLSVFGVCVVHFFLLCVKNILPFLRSISLISP